MRTCPSCEKKYTEHPALSRKDNKTEICSDCGMGEAIDDFNKSNKCKTVEITEKEPTLEELQEIVGGYIEIVTSKNGDADIVMDEEGKLKNKNINVYATQLWQGRDIRDWDDVICGDVVVCKDKARLR